jgi:transcription antitermination factor NusG
VDLINETQGNYLMSFFEDDYSARNLWRELKYLFNQVKPDHDLFLAKIEGIDFKNIEKQRWSISDSEYNMLIKVSGFMFDKYWNDFPTLYRYFLVNELDKDFTVFFNSVTGFIPEWNRKIADRLLQVYESVLESTSAEHEDESDVFEEEPKRVFDVDSYSSDEEIERHIEQIGLTEVIVSPGSRAKTYHKDFYCRWMHTGRTKSAMRGSDLPEVITVSVAEALRKYKRTPCESCFDFWWRGHVKTFVRSNTYDSVNVTDFGVSDIVEVIDGPFATLNGFIQTKYEDERFIVIVKNFGMEYPLTLKLNQMKMIKKAQL